MFDLGAPVGPRGPHRATDWRYWERGKDEPAPEDAAQRVAQRPGRLRAFERHLALFQFKKALDAALSMEPALVCTLFEELRARNGLSIALGGRSARTLAPVLRFLAKHVTTPAYAPVLVPVAEDLVALYGAVLGESADIDALFQQLLRALTSEVRLGEELTRTLGALDALLATQR